MRTITLDDTADCFYCTGKVTYTLTARIKMGSVIKVNMESYTTKHEIFHPSSWRRFKKWVAKIK